MAFDVVVLQFVPTSASEHWDVTKRTNGEWGTGNGERGTGNGKWKMGNEKWERGNWEREIQMGN